MPIVDVQVVQSEAEAGVPIPAQALADALGEVFGGGAARTWVRTHALASASYAENGVRIGDAALPVFVRIMHTRPLPHDALATQVRAVTAAVAACLGRPDDRVHVEYAPLAAGRRAFGGRLVE